MANSSKLNKFAEKLDYYLTLKGWSQEFLAKKLGTTQQSVSRWVNGATQPDLDSVLLVSYFLEEDPSELLGFNDLSADEFVKFDDMFKREK